METKFKKYPVLVKIPIESSTHQNFEIKEFGTYKKNLSIKNERGSYICHLVTDVTESSVETKVWNIIDNLCLSLSIAQNGIFSREYISHRGAFWGIEWLDGIPPTAPGTGVRVLDVKDFDVSLLEKAECVFDKFERGIPNNEKLYSFLIAYTISCRFFNSEMIREAAINFFSIAEMVATLVLPTKIAEKSVYQLKDLHKAAKKLGINNFTVLDEAYKVRGELAHGHPKHLLLMKHSLGEHDISSWSLKMPALKCKEAADKFLLQFLEYENNLVKSISGLS